MANVKAGPKILGIVLLVAGGIFGLRTAMNHGLIPAPGILKSVLLVKTADIPKVQDGEVTVGVTPAKYPTTTAAHVANTLVRGEIWEWNAQMGLILATGGPCTTKGSLMEKYGVNLCLFRQDDTSQMGADLVSCAREHAGGSDQCSAGADFVVIMGDGSGQFIAALDPQLVKLGPSYKLKAIAATGYSRGEDAFMADPTILRDKNAAKGILVVCVLRDGDWNIVIKWAADNGIKVNPDEKTYDPDAINFMNSKDYNQAAQDFAASKSEDRKVVKDGHPTGETKNVTVNAVATWTPGDVVASSQRGGVVKIASSKTYSSQMPATIIGTNAFFQKNRDEIEGMLAATFEGGDQVKAYKDAMHKAAEISATIYADQNADYWALYYVGTTKRDKTGINVSLGGSYVDNLADNQILFGLNPGTNDNFKSTYKVFANYVMVQYADLFKGIPIPDVKDVEDITYIAGAQQKMNGNGGSGGAAETVNYSAAQNGPVVSDRDYNIGFDTGKATLTPDGVKTVSDLKDSTAITNLAIAIDGYTDNTGNESANQALSLARANAVKSALQRAAPKNYPSSRFTVQGHGSESPVGDNSTVAGKAANRRVKISLSGS
jgi:OmpA-OmpF porin, OOP family